LGVVDGSDETERGYQGRCENLCQRDRVFRTYPDRLSLESNIQLMIFLRARTATGYAGNPTSKHRMIKADVPLLRELGVVADEPMVGLMVNEIVELIVKAEEQVIALVVDMDEDVAMLFGNDDFKGDLLLEGL
ncbi:hypothetical protein Tco_1353032, partial [Tanacetum coccineum]